MALNQPQYEEEVSAVARIAGRVALVLGGLLFALGLGWVIVAGGFQQANTGALIFGAILLTVYAFFEPETVRGLFSGGAVRAGSLALLQVVLVLGAVVLINFIVRAKLADDQIDLSKGHVNTLSSQTVQTLHSLDHPVNVTLWYSQQPSEVQATADLLHRYHGVSSQLTVQIASYVYRPDLRAAQNIVPQPGLVVFEYQGKQETTTDGTEQGLTSTLIKLTTGGTPTAYFLTGHGEGSTQDSGQGGFSFAQQQLVSQGFVVKDLNLVSGQVPGGLGIGGASPAPAPAASPSVAASPASSASPNPEIAATPAAPSTTTSIPADADLIVVLDPRSALGADEISALQAYFDKGGRLFLAQRPNSKSNLGDVVKKYGLSFGSGDIVDPTDGLQQQPDIIDVNKYPDLTVTRSLAGYDSLLPINAAVKGTAATGFSLTPVIQSSGDSCEITGGVRRARCESGDAKGPFTLLATLEQTGARTGSRPARMVISGNAQFAENDLAQQIQVAPGNLPLFLNSMNWLAQRDKVISIPPRTIPPDTVFLSPTQKSLVLYGFILFLPALIGAAGLVIYLRRR